MHILHTNKFSAHTYIYIYIYKDPQVHSNASDERGDPQVHSNASDERGIDTIGNQIIDFANSTCIFNAGYKKGTTGTEGNCRKKYNENVRFV